MPIHKVPEYTSRLKFILRLVTLFMFGVSHIEMIVQIALSLQAVTYNLHNHFCMAELLQIISRNRNIDWKKEMIQL